MGYEKSASMLEQESGIPLQTIGVTRFRDGVLTGRWDDVNEFLAQMPVENEGHRQEVKWQQFISYFQINVLCACDA